MSCCFGAQMFYKNRPLPPVEHVLPRLPFLSIERKKLLPIAKLSSTARRQLPLC